MGSNPAPGKFSFKTFLQGVQCQGFFPTHTHTHTHTHTLHLNPQCSIQVHFANKLTCRLINPTKSEIDKVSKKILDHINSTIAKKHNFNQWKNTTAVINWFKSIKNKQHFCFICFDIEEFYPSISQDLLNKALDFAFNYDNINTDERNIIIHAKNSILIHKHIPWQKKGNTTFDVTMGSFLLSQLQDLNINVGLYRGNGLLITNATPIDTENIKKEICRIFNNNGLRITIEANKQLINFLDVTFTPNRSTYQPFTKPNTSLQYVHRRHQQTTVIPILDIKVSFSGNVLCTSVHYKPTDSHSYLLYSSSHPSHVKNSIPYSQFLRLGALCSDDSDFSSKSEEMCQFFEKRGYPVSVVKAGHHRAQQFDRQSSLQTSQKDKNDRIPFTLTFHPHNHAVKSIILNNFKLLQNDPETGRIFSQPPLISFKRDKNVGNFLVRSALKSNEQPGTFKCARSRCKTCLSIVNTSKISGPK